MRQMFRVQWNVIIGQRAAELEQKWETMGTSGSIALSPVSPIRRAKQSSTPQTANRTCTA